MSMLFALMLAAAPVHGASTQARASVTILSGSEIDFTQFDARGSERPGRARISTFRDRQGDGSGAVHEIRLIEFE